MVVLKLDVGSAPGGWRLSDASARRNIDLESWRHPQAMGSVWTIHAEECESSIPACVHSGTGL